MTHDFCTLFDINYLTRGLALYRSLERVSSGVRLWIFCMDDPTLRALRSLDLPGATLVPLSALEEQDPALHATRRERTAVEYCWTATPAVCRYVLEKSHVDAVTYIDADVFFSSDPQPLLDELEDDAVLIVPHRYAPEHRHKELETGTFNVQWVTFKRDGDGLATLDWWHARCIEWCYHRWEDGKIGDQGYLNDFPRLFNRVHALEHVGGGLAPWNVTTHELAERDGRVEVDGLPLVFFHHHSLRTFRNDLVGRLAVILGRARHGVPPLRLPWRTNYPISPMEMRLIWQPYLRALGNAELEARKVAVLPETAPFPASELVRSALRFGRRTARAARSRIDPAWFLPAGRARWLDSWRSTDVARQMVALTDKQLAAPGGVPPYRAFRELLRVLLDDPSLPRPATFLDIGAGAGAYGELLDRWAPDRFDYVGADYSEEIVGVARARWPDRVFEQRDLFAEGALSGFDVVFASALVDVLPDPRAALDRLLGAEAPWVILHRQRLSRRRGYVRVVPGYRGQRTYGTAITLEQLNEAACRHGRRVAAAVDVEGDVRSFLLVRAC